MMIDPPIDKLVELVGCKYALVCLITKRARYLLDKRGEMLEETGQKAVSVAAHDVYDGKIGVRYEE